MEVNGGLLQRVIQLERRTDAHDEAARRREERLGNAEREHAVHVAVADQRHKELREDMTELREGQKWVLRGLWAAAGTFALLASTILIAVFGGG